MVLGRCLLCLPRMCKRKGIWFAILRPIIYRSSANQMSRREYFYSQVTKSQNKQNSSPFTEPWGRQMQISFPDSIKNLLSAQKENFTFHLCLWNVKGAMLCFWNLYFYFWHGESTSTASQLASPASQKSKDFNKVPLLLQDLGCWMNEMEG